MDPVEGVAFATAQTALVQQHDCRLPREMGNESSKGGREWVPRAVPAVSPL